MLGKPAFSREPELTAIDPAFKMRRMICYQMVAKTINHYLTNGASFLLG